MDIKIEEHLKKCSQLINDLFNSLYDLIKKSVSDTTIEVKNKMIRKVPTFYTFAQRKGIELVPLKNHINIKAKALDKYKDSLKNYKFTQTNMLQITVDQQIFEDVILNIFKDTLKEEVITIEDLLKEEQFKFYQ